MKVLDFGLAKVTDAPESGERTEHSPTLTLDAATRVGVILGTAGYMSPEQARGKAVDKRADIWAFGVVLYEMLTAERLFEGETVSDTLIEVATKAPNWERVPGKVRRMLRGCLEKDPKQRLRDIGDVWFLLEDTPQQGAAGAAPNRSRLGVAAWVTAGVFAAGLAISLWALWRATRSVERPLVRLDVDLGPDVALPDFVNAGTRNVSHVAGWDAISVRLGQPNAALHSAPGSVQSQRTPGHGWGSAAFFFSGRAMGGVLHQHQWQRLNKIFGGRWRGGSARGSPL